MSAWSTPGVTEALIKEWNDGVSAGKIAAALSKIPGIKVTRSGVIGKVNRLRKSGVTMRQASSTATLRKIGTQTPSKPGQKRTVQPARPRARKTRVSGPSKKLPSSMPVIMTSAESVALGMGKKKRTMLTVKADECADVLPDQDHRSASEWIVCGLPSIDAPEIRQCIHHRGRSRISNGQYQQLKDERKHRGLVTSS